MEPLDVPEVKQLPELSGEGESPADFADMLLTTLLAYPSADLFAEYSIGEGTTTSPLHDRPFSNSVSWMIDPHSHDLYLENIEFACSPSLASFQAVLARFGTHYMGGQPKNGYALRLLRKHGQLHECHFYLSNTEASGFWIRIYANPARLHETSFSH